MDDWDTSANCRLSCRDSGGMNNSQPVMWKDVQTCRSMRMTTINMTATTVMATMTALTIE